MEAAAEPMISTQVVKALADRLRERGLPVSRLLSAVEIAPARLVAGGDYVPLRHYVQLFELASATAGDPLFGLNMAATAGPETLGALGFLFLSSTSLGDALANLGRYVNVFQDATENRVIPQGDVTSVTYQIRDDRIAPRRQDAEFSVGLITRLIRAYTSNRADPVEVHMEHGPAASDRLYSAAFNCPVYFRQPCNVIVLATADLKITSAALSDKLHEILEIQLENLLTDRPVLTSFRDRVASNISPHTIQHKVRAGRVARELSVSASTLYRRLHREHSSFKQIVRERREALARRLLTSTGLSIGDIALALGYAENASFTRAFKSWTGQSPKEYRTNSRIDD